MLDAYVRYSDINGLNTLQYKRLGFEEKTLYTHVLVKLSGPTKGADLDHFYKVATSNFTQYLETGVPSTTHPQ